MRIVKPCLIAVALLCALPALSACGGGGKSKSAGASTTAAPAATTEKDPEAEAASDWSYSGATGPAHWGSLRPDYKECSTGKAQSPIDIVGAKPGSFAPVRFHYRPASLTVANTGHDFHVEFPKGSYITIGSKRYDVIQFHFHAPAEHLVNGKRYPLELHIVHQAADKSAAVIVVFIRPGAANSTFGKLTARLPARKKEEVRVAATVNILDLVPTGGRTFRYRGGLTTPPCTEGVSFYVYATPLTVSAAQLRRITSVYDHNLRPVQPLNGRKIEESRNG